MTNISKLFAAAALCSTIIVGAPNVSLAATPTLTTASDAQASIVQLSAWPKIRDALLGRSHDYRSPQPPPPPHDFRDGRGWGSRGSRVMPPPPPRPRFQPVPRPQPGVRPHVRRTSFMLDVSMDDGMTTVQPPMV